MSAAQKEFLLNTLRAASLRAKMWSIEFETVGTALRADMVTPDQALQMIKDMGGMDWICVLPDKK